MSNCLHKKIKAKNPRCPHCHIKLTSKEGYNTEEYTFWVCDKCGYEKRCGLIFGEVIEPLITSEENDGEFEKLRGEK